MPSAQSLPLNRAQKTPVQLCTAQKKLTETMFSQLFSVLFYGFTGISAVVEPPKAS